MSILSRTHTALRRFAPLALALLLSLPLSPTFALAEELDSPQPAEAQLSAQEDETKIKTQTKFEYIGNSGNVPLEVPVEDIEAAFEYGDILTVSLLGQEVHVPMCTNFSDVDASNPILCVRKNRNPPIVTLAINMGDFAYIYGITDWNADGDRVPAEGVTEPIEVTITLCEAGGYYDEYVMRQLSYTDVRTDYPNLTDEQFANFREVETTGIRDGVLFRSASPIDPKHNRNAYADAALQANGVARVINVINNEEEATGFPGYEDSYYATLPHVALSMGVDFQSEDSRQKLAQGMRFIAKNPGPYLVHCLEGKDRTGYFVALLECLMGASVDEVAEDYMTSYENYYGVTPGEKRYDAIANGNIITTLKATFGAEDLSALDLAESAEIFLAGIGLTEDEIAAIKHNLGPLPDYVVAFDLCGHGVAIDSQTVDEGGTVYEPDAPAEEGYVFAGWFVDPDYTQAYDFATPVTSDLVLYAKWEAKEAPTPADDTPTPDSKPDDSGKDKAKPSRNDTPKAGTLPKTDDPWNPRPALTIAALGASLALCGAVLRVEADSTGLPRHGGRRRHAAAATFGGTGTRNSTQHR